MSSFGKKVIAGFTRPFLDLFRGLEHAVIPGPLSLLFVALGLAVGWWVYVPVHELLHALACIVTGGEVDELEIAVLYGGKLYEMIFPFVVSGGEYAGRLSGFDTHGNDLIYLATDFGPFLLTLFPGVYLLRLGAARRNGFLFGLSIPVAFGSLMSLTGDAYEIGSILITNIPPWAGVGLKELVRGEDLLKKGAEVAAAGGTAAWLGLIGGTLIGIVWAWLTYLGGGWISQRLGHGPVVAPPPPLKG